MSRETDLHALSSASFKQRITISDDQGRPTVLSDRAFQGVVTAKPGGVLIFPLTIIVLDQSQFPGQFDVTVPMSTLKRAPLDPPISGFRRPSVFAFDISCTYLNDQAQAPESVLFGNFLVHPGA